MKKTLALLLAVLMVVALLAGCAAKPANNESAPADEVVEEVAEKATVTIWYYWETIKHQETLGAEIDKFNASQDKITVEAKYVPFADFKKHLSIGVSAAELPDIVIIDGPDHASYAAMGIFADVTDKLDVSDYFEGPIDSCSLDGKLYGIPFGSNCLSLYYNKDMLDAAGVEVPTTWDELRAAAKALTTDKVYGLAFCSLQNEEGTFNFMPWLWSTGADSYHIDSEEGIKALDFVGSLFADGSMSKEAINWTQGDTMNQFISGNCAMMINGPWQVPTMRAEAPDLNWDVAEIPCDAKTMSVLGGENFGIIDNDNLDNTLEFIKFITDPDEIAGYINNFGYISARKSVAAVQFEDDEIMQKFADHMQYALPRGPHPDWPSISDALSLAFNEVITGSSNSADAAAKAQATIDSILG